MVEEKKSEDLAEAKKDENTSVEGVKEEGKEKVEDNNTEEVSPVADDADEKKSEGACEGGVCATGGNSIFIWVVVVILVIVGIAYYQMKNKEEEEVVAKPLPEAKSQEVKAKVQELIEGKLVPEGTQIEIGDVVEESDLYKMTIKVNGEEVVSYITTDLTKFIPQLIDVKELEGGTEDGGAETEDAPAATEVQTKLDKPVVELFVMSHCPYGTQIEKGILPALKELGATVDAKIKFVDYAMHGEKEVTEQLRQYCIQEKEPQKFHAYLECFLKSEDATSCMRTAAVNQAILTQCATQTDQTYKVTELLKNKETWVSGQFPQFNISKADNEKYGVQGSPTLVINGETIQAGRDSASLLKAICSGFTTPPEACNKELATAAPAPGFGDGVDKTGASTEAECGS